jgi:hypothetical protein
MGDAGDQVLTEKACRARRGDRYTATRPRRHTQRRLSELGSDLQRREPPRHRQRGGYGKETVTGLCRACVWGALQSNQRLPGKNEPYLTITQTPGGGHPWSYLTDDFHHFVSALRGNGFYGLLIVVNPDKEPLLKCISCSLPLGQEAHNATANLWCLGDAHITNMTRAIGIFYEAIPSEMC